MPKFTVTVFQFEGRGECGNDKPVASFGPFSREEADAFARANMGALAKGYYWEEAEHFARPSLFPGLFIPGTRNNRDNDPAIRTPPANTGTETMPFHVRYVGRDPAHRGHTGLAFTVRANTVKVQFDDLSHPMAHGWHEFPATDWAGVSAEAVAENTRQRRAEAVAVPAGYDVSKLGGSCTGWTRKVGTVTLQVSHGDMDAFADPTEAGWLAGAYADDGACVYFHNAGTLAEALHRAATLPTDPATFAAFALGNAEVEYHPAV